MTVTHQNSPNSQKKICVVFLLSGCSVEPVTSDSEYMRLGLWLSMGKVLGSILRLQLCICEVPGTKAAVEQKKGNAVPLAAGAQHCTLAHPSHISSQPTRIY